MDEQHAGEQHAADRHAADRHASETERLDAIVGELTDVRAARAALDARETVLLAEAWRLAQEQMGRIRSRDSRKRELPLRAIAAELGVAVRQDDRGMQGRMHRAAQLTALFPATVAALAEGRIARAHADAVLDAGGRIEDAHARAEFERAVLDMAERRTPGRTRSYARRLAEKLDPRPMPERHAAAARSRAVTVRELDDGMAELTAVLPAAYAFAVLDRLTRQGKEIRKAAAYRPSGGDPDPGEHGGNTGSAEHARRDEQEGHDERAGHDRHDGPDRHGGNAPRADEDAPCSDERTLDQIRADVLTDMLLTGAPAIDPTVDRLPGGLGAIRAHVQITVPVTTCTGTTSGGAELDGRCPVDDATARTLAGEAPGWDRVMLDPVTGMVLAVDRYTPSAEQRRYLRARDQHCRFPGCRMPARRCDIDHTHDAAKGGRTEVCNLACFCRRHHTLKHATQWRVRQLRDGTLEWTSLTGRTYRDDPPPRVVFVPEGDPPPF